jgi:hypothetical protein
MIDDFLPKLDKSDEADIFRVAEEILQNPPDMSRSLLIPPKSTVWRALQDLDQTAYVHEGQYRFVENGEHRFLATLGICNCICIFAKSKTTSFCAHLNPISFEYGLRELKFRQTIGGEVCVSIFKTMADSLMEAFKGVRNQDITVSLVGGWKLANYGTPSRMDLSKYYKHDKRLRTFSSIVLKFVNDTLPDAKIDTTYLNRFDGVSWEKRTTYSKVRKIAEGQSYSVAVLDTQTGKIHLQTSSITDMVNFNGKETDEDFTIPDAILLEACRFNTEVYDHIREFTKSIFKQEMPTPILREYVDKGYDQRSPWTN